MEALYGIAKLGTGKVKTHRGRAYKGMPLSSSVLISILYGCGPTTLNDSATIAGEPSTAELIAGESKAMPIVSTSGLPHWAQSALKDPNPEVRLKVLEKLLEHNTSDVGLAMLVLNDPDERVRGKAMEVIERASQSEERTIQNIR